MTELTLAEIHVVNGGVAIVIPPAVKAIAAAVGIVGSAAGIVAWILN